MPPPAGTIQFIFNLHSIYVVSFPPSTSHIYVRWSGQLQERKRNGGQREKNKQERERERERERHTNMHITQRCKRTRVSSGLQVVVGVLVGVSVVHVRLQVRVLRAVVRGLQIRTQRGRSMRHCKDRTQSGCCSIQPRPHGCILFSYAHAIQARPHGCNRLRNYFTKTE